MVEQATSRNTSNIKIAKNVFYLYIRLFLILIIGLFTSRVILDCLGPVDYGLYNVVGSLVSIFTFVSGALSSSSSRFMAVELEVGNQETQNKVFCMTVNLHLLLIVIVVICAETVGLWYLYSKMIIPEDRLYASVVVFHLSWISAIFSILVIPYRALIIANERMKAFAYLSIFEIMANLIIALSLYYGGIDRLILFGIMSFVVQVGVDLSYYFYCRRYCVESSFHLIWDNKLFKDMISFSGWSTCGNLSSGVVNQCYNLILNLFFGPVVNAARAVAYQVQTKVTQFATNFQIALNPQLIKNYAANDIKRVENLVVMSIKLSFSLMLILFFPILTNIEGVLSLWLVEVPKDTNVFVVFVCVTQILSSMSNPFGVVAEAANQVKKRVLFTVPIFVLALPISYLGLSYGYSARYVFVVALFAQFIALWVEYFIARSVVSEKLYDTFILMCKCIGTLILFMGASFLLRLYFDNSLLSVVICGLICLVLSLLWVLFFIISKKERLLVFDRVRSIIMH